jgi:hypothetical protein
MIFLFAGCPDSLSARPRAAGYGETSFCEASSACQGRVARLYFA